MLAKQSILDSDRTLGDEELTNASHDAASDPARRDAIARDRDRARLQSRWRKEIVQRDDWRADFGIVN
jgi:hypothetical protein